MTGKLNLPVVDALAAMYRETGNPLYAWLCVGQSHAGRAAELPHDVADYLADAALKIGHLANDKSKTSTQKTKEAVAILGLKGTGSSNPFAQRQRDIDDVNAYNNFGMHLFLQKVANKERRPTRERALKDVKGLSRATANKRLERGKRLDEIWNSHTRNKDN